MLLGEPTVSLLSCRHPNFSLCFSHGFLPLALEGDGLHPLPLVVLGWQSVTVTSAELGVLRSAAGKWLVPVNLTRGLLTSFVLSSGPELSILRKQVPT